MKLQRSFLAGLLGCVLAASASAQRPGGLAASAAEILGRVEGARSIAAGCDELAALGPEALPVLFGWLVAGEVPRPGAGPLELDACRRTTVQCALGSLPRSDVLAFLAALARRSRTQAERAAGLDLLARIGVKDDLKLVLELGSPDDPQLPPPAAQREALEKALVAIATREAGAARWLAGFFPRAQPFAQEAIAHVLGAPCDEESLGLLASLLGSSTRAADTVLLLELERVASTGVSTRDLQVFERVRGHLGHPDRTLGLLACLVVEKLRDHGAVPDLIVLLEDGDANVRARAHAALGRLTGLAYPAEPGPWLAWLDEGLAWWESRSEACRLALVSGSPAEAAAAIQELAHQRLFLDRVAQILALGLERTEPAVVEAASLALVAVEPARAHERLASADHRPGPEASARVQASLRRHTPAPRPVRRPITDRITE